MLRYAEKHNLRAAASVAICAAECAVLIAAQVALGAVAGVELVTVLLLTFSAYFGIVCGVTASVCFSLLRCLIWGFSPTAITLYLIYYPLFAMTFALLGKSNDKPTLLKCAPVNAVLLIFTIAPAVSAALNAIKISRIYAATVTALLYSLSGISFLLLVCFNAVFILVRKGKIGAKYIKLFIMCAVACVFTACFTLLDDIITPLFYQMGKVSATAYFYASFIAMVPQIICCAVSVSLLYFPLTFIYSKAYPRRKFIDKRGEK